MSNIYFFRHGESESNQKGILCGAQDNISISTRGANQVKSSLHLFERLEIHHIFSSPMKRAMQTTLILNKVLNCQIHYVDDFKEQDYGDWENQPFQNIRNQFLNNLNPPNGETYIDFILRIKRGLIPIKNSQKNSLIISHGGVGIELLDIFGKQKILIDNAQLIKLR